MLPSEPHGLYPQTAHQAERRSSFRNTLLALEDPTRLIPSIDLDVLSDLTAADLGRFQETWQSLSSDRRRALLAHLVELAEDHVDAYFDPIYLWLLNDEDAQVRAQAIEGLWEDEDVRLVGPLLGRLEHDEASGVRAIAAASLGRFLLLGELDQLDPSVSKRIEDALLETFSDDEDDILVRRRALESLAYSSQEFVQDLILEAYEDDDESLHLSAVFAMGRSADLRWKDTVLEELSNADAAMRFEAARASGELELADAVPELIGLLEEDDVELRDSAVWALGRIGGPAARRALQACANSRDPDLREAAEDALSEMDFLIGEDGPPAFFHQP
jgi:HEAT repeat protein